MVFKPSRRAPLDGFFVEGYAPAQRHHKGLDEPAI
jgi:hypothetical protein